MNFFTALCSLVIFASSLVPSVIGHGHLDKLIVDGQDFKGPDFHQEMDSVIRMVDAMDPITDINSDDMNCGRGAANRTATQSAPAKPGSKIGFAWVSGENTDWPHNTGPVQTYIASCGGDCSKFESLNAQWIKIDEAGRTDGQWVQGTTLFKGQPYEVTLPQDLPNGDYILRNEIMGLHVHPPEFYPACSQITVTGGSSSRLDVRSSDDASFPGTYKADDPGLTFDAYTDTSKPYPFPGPAIPNLAAGGGSASSSSDSATASSSLAPTPTTSADDGDCTDDPSSSDPSSSDPSSSDPSSSDPSSGDPTTTLPADVAIVTITEFVTITPQATKPTSTKTVVETVTASGDGASAAAATSSSNEYRPRRRSRIMARSHI
ncbi:hypothetical protein FRB99_002097 [Tulasnella sp. 403]|nr:hypothetical protein FRB99_002097 [Tulasnella sp. 403]